MLPTWQLPSSCHWLPWCCWWEVCTSTSPGESGFSSSSTYPAHPCPALLPHRLLCSHRLQGKSPLQLPRTHPRPYNRITVESAFDNPTYETGVSIHVGLDTSSGLSSLLPWVGIPVGPAKSRLCLGKVASGPTNLLQVSNSPQSLSFAGDERI